MIKRHKLLIKQHKKTKLKYLCKTTRKNFISYPGSGAYWRKHLDKHGYNFETTVIGEYETKRELKEAGIHYSKLWDVVKSEEWANLVFEAGDGGDTSKSPKYQKSLKERREAGLFAGKNNPMYGRKGDKNPNLGKKLGKNPKLSKTLKKVWKNNPHRRRIYSEKAKGSKNPRAKKCVVDGITFGCLKDAAKHFSITSNGYWYHLMKNHRVKIL